MYAAVCNLIFQSRIDQLLLFNRSQALEDGPDRRDVIVTAIALHVKLTILHVIL